MTPRLRPLCPWPGQRAIAAIEFSVSVPVFVLILVGLVDLGRVTMLRMRLEADVAAVENFALINASQVNSTSGAALASSLGQTMGGNLGATLNSGVVIVDAGPSVTITNGSAASSGTAANADACYCPTGTTSPWTWGSSVTCGSSCASGLMAGKFVSVTEAQTYVPIFATYHMLQNNQVSASGIVQVQ